MSCIEKHDAKNNPPGPSFFVSFYRLLMIGKSQKISRHAFLFFFFFFKRSCCAARLANECVAAVPMVSWPRLSLAWVSVAFLHRLSSSDAFITSARAIRHGLGQVQASRSYVSMSSPVAASPAAVKEGAVIVGGGPSGLATALMLAKRGWTDISIIEKTPSADFFDPRVAFV